jgi:CTP:molybdopterin cytidylyltransferase MocA
MESNWTASVKYSIVILLGEANDEVVDLVSMVMDIFSSKPGGFEIIIIANGTEGFLNSKLRLLPTSGGHLKAFAFGKKTTEAVCLKAGVKEAVGSVIVACGSFPQITKESFTRLIDEFDEGPDIICPWRRNRVDPPFNQFQSRVFNALVRKISSNELHDLSCTVRVLKREVLEETDLYGNMNRFLPVIAAQKGFTYKEVECDHLKEKGKTGLYKPSEYIDRILDILTLYFLVRFSKKPLRFFSMLGASSFAAGAAAMMYVLSEKLVSGAAIGDRPMMILAVVFMVFGAQAFSVGLLGEIIAFSHGRHKRAYTIEKIK